jgi:hypothetical protein
LEFGQKGFKVDLTLVLMLMQYIDSVSLGYFDDVVGLGLEETRGQ